MTELADLELWIRENIAEIKGEHNEQDTKNVFEDGYCHAMFMVIKQIKKMRKEGIIVNE